MREGLSPRTVLVSGGRPRNEGDPLNFPIGATSTYRAGGEHRYARSGTETWEAFEEVMGHLEGGVAVAFSSGVASMAAILELTPPTGVVAACSRMYVGSVHLLRDLEGRGRFSLRWFPDLREGALAGADVVVLEDPTNPALGRIDLAAAAAETEGLLVVDNTVATPLARRPLDLGADVVVHSATKYLGGHSDLLMGVAVARDEEIVRALREYRTLHGAVPGAMEAFLALRGLRTLDVRMSRATSNASELARRLAEHPGVAYARHPGVGSLIALELVGGASAGDAMIDRLRLITHATSLGGVESTLERRARWAQESFDVSDALVRISVGIEDVEDLWEDLETALG